MSTEFDLQPTDQGTPPVPATTLLLPTQTTTTSPTRTVPVPAPDDEPAGSLTAFLVTGGPAVAVIAGCYLMWAYGPWILLGALLLAAVAAIVAIRAVFARGRRSRSQGRAAAPTRAGPSGIRSLLGSGRTAPAARSGAGGSAGGAKPRSGGASPAGKTASTAAGARAAQRKSLLARGGASPAAGKKTASVRKSPPVGSNLARAAKTLAPKPAKAPGGSGSGTPARKAPAAGPARRAGGPGHARPGLLRRTLGKTMPKGRTTTAPGSGPAAGPAGRKAAVKKPSRTITPKLVPRPAGPAKTPAPGKKSAAATRAKAARRIAATGRTASGRRKIPVNPVLAAAAARRRTVTAKISALKTRTTPAGTTPARPITTPGRSKAAGRIARTARRTATRRKVHSARAKGLHGARRGARATSAIVSPVAARAFMGTGKALGWAQRRMLRVANSTNGPAWSPRLARGLATGIGGVMAAGLWVSRRRSAQKWLLTHYASTGLGNPAAVAARATKAAFGPARTSPAGHTAKPGPAVRVTAPRSPHLTLPGATVSSTPDAIADAFEQYLTNFEPESVSEFSAHFASFAPMLERFAQATSQHAQRLGDEYGVKGGVVDMLDQFGSAFGGMHDLAAEVVNSWGSEHAEDIDRTENPRPHEAEVWNYKPGE